MKSFLSRALCAVTALFFLCPSGVLATNTLSEAYRAQAHKLYQRGQLERASELYRKSFYETDTTVGGDKVSLQQTIILSEWGQVESKLLQQYERSAQMNPDSQSVWQEKIDATRRSAVEHLELALQGQERLLGTNNVTCARTLDTLASTLFNAHQVDLAESLFQKALSIRRTNGDSASAEVAYELWQLAKIASAGTRYSESVTLSQSALPLLNRHYGPSNSASMQCCLTMAEALYQLKKYGESEPLALKCLGYWRTKMGTSYALTQQSETLLKEIRTARADAAQQNLRRQLDKSSGPADLRLIPFIESWRDSARRAQREDDAEQAEQWLAGMQSNRSARTAHGGSRK